MKIKKIVSIIILVIILVSSLVTISNAAVTTEINPSNYYPGNKRSLTEADYQVAFNHTSTVLNAITTVGIIVAIVSTMILGIKYMFGSIEQRAEYKKTMLPMLIGAILLFTVSTVVSIIYNVMQDVNK